MSAATMPTKPAATSSMTSMNQFIGPRGPRGAAALASCVSLTSGPAMFAPHDDGSGVFRCRSWKRAVSGRDEASGRGSLHQYPALYCASESFSSFMIVSGLPPAPFTPSAHFCCSGSADFFHSPSCASVIL